MGALDRYNVVNVRALVDSSNRKSTHPSGEPAMESGDWRAQLHPNSRQRIVNKMLETLNKHLPFSCEVGLDELRRVAALFEEKVFNIAVDLTDYLHKLSMKMVALEIKYQNNPAAAESSTATSAANDGTSVDSSTDA